MKLFFLIIPAITFLYSCNSNHEKSKSNAGELSYRSIDTTAGALSAKLTLTGNAARQELTAQIKLTNSGSSALEVQEIAIATPEGVRSMPETGGLMPFSLATDKDTVFNLKFRPLNDLKLYQVTGMQGSFKPVYTVTVSYKTAGNDNPVELALRSEAEKNAYLAYTNKYKKADIGYLFNTQTGFNEKEKKYLSALKQISQPPFVYLTEQEIAISGLNFRLKSHYQNDTLLAELFVVNHSDFPVKVIPDSLDIVTGKKTLPGESKTITLEKISGAGQDQDMMEKGDRVLIHFKKYLKIKIPGKDSLAFHIRKAFMLTGKKPLFDQDIELLPKQF